MEIQHLYLATGGGSKGRYCSLRMIVEVALRYAEEELY